MKGDFRGRLRELLQSRARQRLDSPSALQAAVLVPLFSREQGGLHVLFTKRTDTMPHHGGQVAFPGGQHRPGIEESLLETAVREAHEEVGLRPEDIQVLGELDEIHTLRSNFLIAPFVAFIPYPYAFRPNPAEVAEIFSVPVTALRDPACRHEELWNLEGTHVTVTTIRYAGHVIWGATQRISQNLVEMLAALDGTSDGLR